MIRCSWPATGVIATVMQRMDGAAGLARKLVVGLRQRGWDGEDELADQLEAQLGSGPAAMLRALPVDLEELAGILEGDPLSVGVRIDIRTGEVWPQAAIEYAVETGAERKTRTPLMIPSGGCRSTARAHARATGTWSCSSRPSGIPAGPSARPSRSQTRGAVLREAPRCPDCPIPAMRPRPVALLLCCLQDSIAWLAPGGSRSPWHPRGRLARFPRMEWGCEAGRVSSCCDQIGSARCRAREGAPGA
jgi:hypothetical protein